MDSLISSAIQLFTPTTLLAVLVAILALLVVMWLVMRRGNAESLRSQQALDALDTLTAWQPQATRILTRGQRIVYSTLYRALPEYMVLAQVPIERFIRVPTRHSYAEWRSRVGQLCVDFLVCDSASEVIAVIDVRLPESQASTRSRDRQARIQRVLKGAGIPYYVWREDAVPSTAAAREIIVPREVETPEPLPSTTVPGGLHPELEHRRHMPARTEGPPSDYPVPDEYIELGGDPTPSTWFDQINQSHARHAPLQSKARPVSERPRSGSSKKP
jgi:hypothetical protein